MRIRNRAIGPAMLGAALIVSLGGVARAGGEAGGDITFRLILRGDVVEGDAFSLGVNELAEPPTIIGAGTLCGPESLRPEFRRCEPGTYEFVVRSSESFPVGTELEYVWSRTHGEGTDREDTRIYADTVTVTEQAQLFTVVYDYEGGAEPGGDSGNLPDTATGAPVDVVPVGFAVVVGSVVMALATASRRFRGPA